MTTLSARTHPVRFFARFVRHPRQVGSLLPSSPRLADVMLRDLALAPGDVVLEYGPGTGALTDRIAAHLQSVAGARYLGIERDRAFYDILARRADLAFAHGSVEAVREHLRTAGLPAPRLIISGLPLILMPTEVMASIVATASEILVPGGSFRTFSYLHSWPMRSTIELRRLMRTHFDQFEISAPVWSNVPPAVVLCGDRRRRADPARS